MRLNVAGRSVEVVALPQLMEQFHAQHKSPGELFQAVKIYNAIPAESEFAYREAVLRAYAEFVQTAAKSRD